VRFSAFIAAFYYFVITVGISLSLHFCHGELSCFSLLPGNNTWCCHSDTSCQLPSDEPNLCEENCCSTELVTIALDIDFTVQTIENHSATNLCDFSVPQVQHEEFVAESEIHINITRGPPITQDLFLVHSQFIFYG